MPYSQTIKHAQAAHQNGNLQDWIADYLENEGHNPELLKHIRNHPTAKMDIRQTDLKALKRICGPEEGMPWRETAEVWRKHLDEIKLAVQNGYELPPLIITDFWDYLNIADGSHRCGALLELGYDKYWAIFITTPPSLSTLR